jgi:UDPglucose--hexose-1-phosphate uridylyltransferase
MPQFRKDPFGPAWVIISPERGLEPSDFGSVSRHDTTSPLAPGHEPHLGREIRIVRPVGASYGDSAWTMRVVESQSGLLEPDKPFAPSGPELFRQAASSGYQELIIEHPKPQAALETMPREHVIELIKLYRDRLAYVSSLPGIQHVQLTRNVGKVAGAAYNHPHAQILAVPVANRWIEEEASAADEYFKQHRCCLFCDVITAEIKARERIITQNEHFVALAPYASKTPFETWILPRQHSSGFTSIASNTVPYLADLLRSTLQAMNTALNDPPYNIILHTFPNEDNPRYHWHIEVLPRLTRQAGFDWSSGFYVNPTPPEDAARFLKETLALQEVTL